MKKIFQYSTSEERGKILNENSSLFLIEERNVSEGNFLVFSTDPLPKETLEEKISRLEKQIQQDNLIQFEVLATIYEEIVMKG